jgi:hypothetical protein
MTFQTPLTGLGQTASKIAREYPLIRPIITFVRTPVNLLKFSAERLPVAPMVKDWRADIKAGGARRDLALARMTMGTGLAATAYSWALEGRLTGSQPSDPAKNRLKRADGWQPYSVRIGDQWVSYSRLDPFAMTLGLAADLVTKADGMTDKQLENYSMLFVASIMSQMADKTWLSGISDFTQVMTDPQRFGPAYLHRLGGALLLPNVLAQTARAIDPVQRERGNFSEELQSRIPGLSDNLLPQRDIWGQPIVNQDRIGPEILNPFRQTTVQNDPVNREMLAINARFGLPGKTYTIDGVKSEWTPEQYDRLRELSGGLAHDRLTELVTGPGWQQLPAESKLKAAKKVFDKARDEARGAVLGRDDRRVPAATGMRSDDVPPPPPGFTIEGEAAGVNVYQDLQQAIPGVRMTSGFRTPEYQQDLRRRGYRPAQNSAHLDGSALDMLPPAGKSMEWLRGQVRDLYPNAKLLIHDGHLHAEFPGYYGAPPLEGARGAGLSNPLANIPPPPPGFQVDAR